MMSSTYQFKKIYLLHHNLALHMFDPKLKYQFLYFELTNVGQVKKKTSYSQANYQTNLTEVALRNNLILNLIVFNI